MASAKSTRTVTEPAGGGESWTNVMFAVDSAPVALRTSAWTARSTVLANAMDPGLLMTVAFVEPMATQIGVSIAVTICAQMPTVSVFVVVLQRPTAVMFVAETVLRVPRNSVPGQMMSLAAMASATVALCTTSVTCAMEMAVHVLVVLTQQRAPTMPNVSLMTKIFAHTQKKITIAPESALKPWIAKVFAPAQPSTTFAMSATVVGLRWIVMACVVAALKKMNAVFAEVPGIPARRMAAPTLRHATTTPTLRYSTTHAGTPQ
mmetsp:Transcript_53127/g.78764  ORF Transcript_53127/g.78764 Transcript_53127/m.78764 type:complete len:262 (+) Transcript_53127:946-1731(+)